MGLARLKQELRQEPKQESNQGARGLSRAVQEAKQRRDEASSRVQGPPQQIERPSMQQPRIEPQPQGPSQRIERPRMQQPQRISPAPQQHYGEPTITPTYNPPKLPEIRPTASPVMELKRRTAGNMQYTPEATTILYDTPTRVRYGDFETHTHDSDPDAPLGSKGIAGQFYGHDQDAEFSMQNLAIDPNNMPRYEIYIAGQNEWNPIEETLAHEFAHKWHYEIMPERYQWKWAYDYNRDPAAFASPYSLERVSTYTPELMFSPAGEAYAFNAQRSMNDIDDEVRNEFYAGLFKGDAPQYSTDAWSGYYPLPPGFPGDLQQWGPPNWQVPPTSDVLRERAPWSLENGVWG